MQSSSGWHAVSQLPQCRASFVRSAHSEPQSVRPCVQVQLPPAQSWSSRQVLPQVPQYPASSNSNDVIHDPLQSSVFVGQTHSPSVQTLPAGHCSAQSSRGSPESTEPSSGRSSGASASGSLDPASGTEWPTKSSDVNSEQPNAVVATSKARPSHFRRRAMVLSGPGLVENSEWFGSKAPQAITPRTAVHPPPAKTPRERAASSRSRAAGDSQRAVVALSSRGVAYHSFHRWRMRPQLTPIELVLAFDGLPCCAGCSTRSRAPERLRSDGLCCFARRGHDVLPALAHASATPTLECRAEPSQPLRPTAASPLVELGTRVYTTGIRERDPLGGNPR